MPVVVYTVLYNLPKFFELDAMCCSLEKPGLCSHKPLHNFTEEEEGEDGDKEGDRQGVCGARAVFKITPTKLRSVVF